MYLEVILTLLFQRMIPRVWGAGHNCESSGHLSVSKVLIFCVEFWELSHLTRDLSQTEKKIIVVTTDNFDHFE